MENNLPTLEQVDAFESPGLLVPRIAKEHDYSDEDAANLYREAKRMLYLHARTKQPVSPSLKVDDAWHEMLMFTRFYQKYADFIGSFVHHDPTPGMPDGGKMYAKTKEMYEKEFGMAPDPRYWG